MPTLDVSACSEAALRAVMLICGANRQYVSPKALKVFLVLLCDARLSDKLSYLFQEFSTGAGHQAGLLTRRSLSTLLRLLCKLPDFMGESRHFGHEMVEAAVNQCFARSSSSPPSSSSGISSEEFMAWAMLEPQVMVWVPTFYRLTSSKSIRHSVSCSGCRCEGIAGLR